MAGWVRCILIQCCALLVCAGSALGHDFGAMKVELRCSDRGMYTVTVTADLDHVPSSIRGDFPRQFQLNTAIFFDQVTQSLPAAIATAHVPLKVEAGSKTIELRCEGTIPHGAKTIAFQSDLDVGEYYLLYSREGKEGQETQWLDGKQRSREFVLDAAIVERSKAELFGQYTWLGFTHIIPLGADHILFVLCLYLLGTKFKALAMQVTAFTIAHSVSLALSMTGVVTLPSSIVEPLIAISIVYVALENIMVKEMPPQRLAVVFMFGLLHGLGFAGVLAELGMPREHFGLTLVGFNLGVELGQFAVIAAAFVLVGTWFSKKEWYRTRIIVPLSGAIALFALYLSIDRLFF